MSEFDENLDYFDDADLAAPQPLPTGTRYIGVVASVDTSQAEPGKFRKIEGKLLAAFQKRGDTRTSAPQITVNFTAIGLAGQAKGFPDGNWSKNAKQDYFVGKEDRVGRNSLARLIRDTTGKSDEEMKQLPLIGTAKTLEKAYVTFEVTHTQGNQGAVFQNPVKIKAATSDEVAAVL